MERLSRLSSLLYFITLSAMVKRYLIWLKQTQHKRYVFYLTFQNRAMLQAHLRNTATHQIKILYKATAKITTVT
jgi:hypothetical protein